MTRRSPNPRWWRQETLAVGLGLAALLYDAPDGTAQAPPPPPDRLLRALDKDGDGCLSPAEIAGASEALRSLDEDGDGTVEDDELAPPRPSRGARRGDAPGRSRGQGRRPTRGGLPEGPPPAETAPSRTRNGEERVPLVIRGGHDTDPRDRGRPVALVAGALGVTPEVFRDAFSRVRPAPAGTAPDGAQVRRNKDVLLAALGPYGITNDQLDRVSDHYRYNPGRGEMWPVRAAAGHAVFKDGAFTSVALTDPGSGYSSPPAVSVPGHPELVLRANLGFSRDLRKNGSIVSLTPAGDRGEAR